MPFGKPGEGHGPLYSLHRLCREIRDKEIKRCGESSDPRVATYRAQFLGALAISASNTRDPNLLKLYDQIAEYCCSGDCDLVTEVLVFRD